MSGRFSTLTRIVRSLTSAEGRSVAWTRLLHGAVVQQTATTTSPNRYPELFDALAARLLPEARILSFGCSTGEELLALRQRLPNATIVGVEINPRARRVARRRTADDPGIKVVAGLPDSLFDAVTALAVLQREPHRVEDEQFADLSRHYPFARFDAALAKLVERLKPGGVLVVTHAQYRVEDSSAAPLLTAIVGSPELEPPLFDRSSRRYAPPPPAASLFVKGADRCEAISAPSAKS